MSETPAIFEDAQLFHLIVNVSPAGMVIVDREGLIVHVNRQAMRWLGYEEEELIGQHVEVLVPEMHRQSHGKKHTRYMRSPRARPMAAEKALSARRKDGSEFPVDISLHPFKSGDSQFVLANLVDATQRHQAERVPQERLAAIGEMVAGLAHESRNALQRARACLDLLELELPNESDQDDLIVRIRKSLEDLEHNYDEVRNYAAPINLVLEEVEVADLVREVVEELESEFPDRKIDLEIQVEEDASCNRVDSHRLKQVFRNVIENALQASEAAAPIHCRIRLQQEVDQLWQVVEVEDHGSGIEDAVAERIFEPFFTTKQSGTGLGLAICRRIVDAHDGGISASCNSRGGTTLKVTLPVLSFLKG